MTKEIYLSMLRPGRKKFAVLIDPENHTADSVRALAAIIKQTATDFIFVGGSLVSSRLDDCIKAIREIVRLPIILFPGSLLQLTDCVDAILLMSLISGRNPDYLIGQQVQAAPYLKKSGIEVISCGYILVGEGNQTSVEIISNTRPIPMHKHDIVAATAMAGEMMGHKVIYLEAGSGSSQAVSTRVIEKVKRSIGIPLIVGGGISSPTELRNAYQAGADIVVVGTAFEQTPALLYEWAAISS